MKARTFELTERDFEYPYANAIRDIANYHEYVGDLEVPYAYTINKEDLLFLINELMNMDEKAIGIRCYPAREYVPETIDPNGKSISAHYHHHLLMVGVVEDNTIINGTPLYPYGRDIYNVSNDDNRTSRIFDLSRPCPRMCDLNSELFAAASGGEIGLLPAGNGQKK